MRPSSRVFGGRVAATPACAAVEALVELAQRHHPAVPEYPEQVRQLIGCAVTAALVAGVLQMLELPEAGRLLGDLKFYVAAFASGEEQAPDAQRRDALADVIVSAELYMQSAIEPGADRAQLLVLPKRHCSGSVCGRRNRPEPAPAAQLEPAAAALAEESRHSRT